MKFATTISGILSGVLPFGHFAARASIAGVVGDRAPAALSRAMDRQRLELSVLDRPDRILALQPEWQALEAACLDTALFQSFAWCRNHLEMTAGQSGFYPAVICLRRGGRLVGLLPLSIRKQAGLKLLTGLCEPFQQYSEILLDPAEPVELAAIALRQALPSIGVDYAHFGQVRDDGPLSRCLTMLGAGKVDGDRAPYVDIASWPDFESYQKSLNAKTRKNMRNAVNRLERDAPVTHEFASSGAGLRAVVERAYLGRQAWLQRLGLTSRAFRDVDFGAFIKRFANGEAAGIETVAMTLCHGGRPISDQWGFIYRGRYYAFMATWDPVYEAASPGKLHLGEVIRTCFAQGCKVADFMIPGVAYKLTWTGKAAEVNDRLLPVTLRGRLHVLAWLQFLRPLSKRIMAFSPVGLRNFAVRWILPRLE